MKHLKKITAMLLALLMVVGLTACGAQEEVFAVRVDLPEELATLDPAMVTNDAERTVVSHLYENLMKLTHLGEGQVGMANGLAANYECVNNLDGTQTYTFSLRPGITWSDGEPVKAEDFVYAWQRLADPKTESPNAEVLEMVAGYAEARKKGDMSLLQVSAPDERTLVVALNRSCPNFPRLVCTQAATMPLRADVVERSNWDTPQATLVVNGAYRVVKARQNGVLTLTSDDSYHDFRRLGPEELQFTFGGSGADAADFVLTYAGVEDETLWQAAPVARTGSLVINQMATLSEELRLAMGLVIDRQELSDLLGSVYVPAEGLIPHGICNTQGAEFRSAAGVLIDSDPETYEARCQQAKDLLGYQTIPENVTLLYVSDPATDAVARTLRKTWQEKLGLTVALESVEQEAMLDALQKGEFAAALVMMESRSNDPAELLQQWTSASKENYANIHNSAYDLLLQVSDKSASEVARDAYLADAERMLLESGYVIPICHARGNWQLKETLQGVFHDGFGRFFFTGVVEKAK